MNRDFGLRTPHGVLPGQLALPTAPRGLILVAQLHAAPLDRVITANLANRSYAILNISLLTSQEASFPDAAHNVPLLAQRLIDTLDLVRSDADTEKLPVGLFATAPVTPAAVRTAARRDRQVQALVCHGGLVDLAGVQYLNLLAAPLLMLVDAEDTIAAASFQRSASHLSVAHELHRLKPDENPTSSVARWFGEHLQAV